MPEELRAITFSITVETNKRTIVKEGSDAGALEDALWELYDEDLLPFAPDEEEEDDDDADDDSDDSPL
jgi:hypothetical protein